MKKFYARVSTKDQNLDRQLNAAKEVEADIIYADKKSGKNFDRDEYQRMKSELTKDDCLFVLSLDRLGRDYDEIGREWGELTSICDVVVMDFPLLDTRQYKDLTGRFLTDVILKLLSYVAQSEREKILSRQRQGLDAMPIEDFKRVSKRTGNPFGRKRNAVPEFEKFYDLYKDGKISAKEGAEAQGISLRTFYRISKVVEEKRGQKSAI